MQWTITVDRQPRVGLNDQKSIERVGQSSGERRRPDVPGDVALQLERAETQSAQGSRQ